MRRALPAGLFVLLAGCATPPAELETPDPDSDPNPAAAVEPETAAVEDESPPPATIAVHFEYACALGSNARVYCWGANDRGQLGVSGTHTRTQAVEVPGIEDAVEVQVSHDLGCARTSAGAINCWFDGGGPRSWADDETIVQLAMGTFVTCSLRDDHVARCATSRRESAPIEGVESIAITNGRPCFDLADGPGVCLDDGLEPLAIADLPEFDEMLVSDRYDRLLVRDVDDRVLAVDVGEGTFELLDGGNGTLIRHLARVPPGDTSELVAGSIVCRRDGDGRLECRGSDGTPGLGRPTPPFVTAPTRQDVPLSVAISRGFGGLCWLGRDGAAGCRGFEGGEQLGPKMTAVAAGDFFACALGSNGRVACGGEALVAPGAVAVPGVDNATAITAAGDRACALLRGGKVSCWDYGETGAVAASDVHELEPSLRAVAISSTEFFTCALDKRHGIRCFEEGIDEAPDFTAAFDHAPKVARVFQGSDIICALSADGEVYCDPFAAFGGDPFEDPWVEDASPDGELVRITFHDRVTGLGLAYGHACAAHTDGSVSCWGDNQVGELGRGLTGGASGPEPVPGLTDVVAVDAGGNTSCALKIDGSVWCWGMDVDGAGPGWSDAWAPVGGVP